MKKPISTMVPGEQADKIGIAAMKGLGWMIAAGVSILKLMQATYEFGVYETRAYGTAAAAKGGCSDEYLTGMQQVNDELRGE